MASFPHKGGTFVQETIGPPVAVRHLPLPRGPG
jgi:hypothetical protein